MAEPLIVGYLCERSGCQETRDELDEARARIQTLEVEALAPLLAAAKTVAGFTVSWEPLTPGDISELTAAIGRAERVLAGEVTKQADQYDAEFCQFCERHLMVCAGDPCNTKGEVDGG